MGFWALLGNHSPPHQGEGLIYTDSKSHCLLAGHLIPGLLVQLLARSGPANIQVDHPKKEYNSRSCQSCCTGGEGIVVAVPDGGIDEGAEESCFWVIVSLGDHTPSRLLAILRKVLNSSSDLAITAGSNYRWSSPGQGKSKACLGWNW